MLASPVGPEPPGSDALRSRAFLLALAAVAAWWIVDLALWRAGPPHPLDDVWEDALLARSLLQGHGFHTLMIYPPIWGLRDPATLMVPALVHGPLLPLLLAPLLALFGPGAVDQSAWLAALAAALAAAFAGRAAWRVVSPAAGFAALPLVTLAPILLVGVHHAMSVAFGALAVAVAMDALLRERPRPLVAGIALGLGYLVRPELLLAAPLLALGPRLRRAELARFAAAFVACALPWWIHHARIVGSPFFNLTSYTLLGYSRQHPGLSTLDDFSLTPARWPAVLAAEWPVVLEKAQGNAKLALAHAARIPSSLTGWLMPVGLVALLARRERRRLALAGTLVALVPVAMMVVTRPVPLYAAPMLPLHALAAAAGAQALCRTRRWRLPAGTWVPALLALSLAAAWPGVRTARTEAPLERALLRDERAALAGLAAPPAAAPPAPLFSDRPDFVAWTTGRPAIVASPERYVALYPLDGRAVARPPGLPARRDPALTWFHDGHWARGHRIAP